MHQGIQLHILTSQGKLWDLQFYRDQVQRLKFHPGFPSGEHLLCPVFLQDKFEYLIPLMSVDFANPTFKFPRPKTDQDFNRENDRLKW